jgi:hypothetical protein
MSGHRTLARRSAHASTIPHKRASIGLLRATIAPASPAGRRRLAVALYALLAAIVLVPVFSVQIPCLGDYLNHLARIHVLTATSHAAALQKYYEPDWRLVPYYGMDLPVAALAPIFGLYGAGRIFVAICVLMPVIAAATLRHALTRRIGLWPAAAFLVSYNYLLALGFLNYIFSAGLAVMLFAGWISAARWPRWRRLGLFALAATALYLCHAFAFVAYGLLVGGHEIWAAYRARQLTPSTRLLNLGIAAAQAIPTIVLSFTVQDKVTFGAHQAIQYSSAWGQAAAMLMPLYFPGPLWITAAFLCIPIGAVLVLKRWNILPAMRAPIAVTLVAACFVPHMLFNVWGADFRLPLVIAMVAAGALAARAALHPRVGALAIAGLCGLVLLRSGEAFTLLRRLDPVVRDVQDAVAHIPPGQRVLVVESDPYAATRPASYMITGHLGLLATIDRDAFIPYLFIHSTAIRLKPAFEESASPNGHPITDALLREGMAPSPDALRRSALSDGGRAYWLDWPHKFDDVLYIHFGKRPADLPAILQPAAANRTADLYRIVLR